MNSKDKGNIGEAMALTAFTERGIQVSIPFGDNARYDLIAEFNGKLNKIQVKYCNQKISENNSISCPCASSANHTTNKHYSTYENDIDYFVFYLVEWNEILIVPIEKVKGKKTLAFRKDKPANNQSSVNYIYDYTFEKFFEGKNNHYKVEKDPEERSQKEKTNLCIDCKKPISNNGTRCLSCAAKLQPRKVENRPNREELKNLIRTTPFIKIGEQFGVSDNTIRKWCVGYSLPKKVSDIKAYSDEDWKNV